MTCCTCGNDHSVMGDCGFDTQWSNEVTFLSEQSVQEDAPDWEIQSDEKLYEEAIENVANFLKSQSED